MFTADCGKPGPRVPRQLWIPCPQHSGSFKGEVQARIVMMTAMMMMVVVVLLDVMYVSSGGRCWLLLGPFCHRKCGLTKPFMGEEESMPCRVHVLKGKCSYSGI